MRYGGLAAVMVASVLLAASGAGARSALATGYRPMSLFGGYSEKEIEPGVWRVTGTANGPAGQGFGRDMAIYRAAELLSARGFAYVQVIDQHGKETMRTGSGQHVREFLKVTVRGAQGPEAPGDCRSKVVRACFTFPAAVMMARLAPNLGLAPRAALPANMALNARPAAAGGGSSLSDCAAFKWGDGTSACR